MLDYQRVRAQLFKAIISIKRFNAPNLNRRRGNCAIIPGTVAFVDEDVAVKVWNRRAEVKGDA